MNEAVQFLRRFTLKYFLWTIGKYVISVMWQTTSGVNDLLLFQNEHLSNPQLQRTTRKYNRDTNFLVINGEKGQSLQMFSLDNLSDKSDHKK